MAQFNINYGNTANDGTGDPLRTAFVKTDDNFDQIWAAGPVGSNITITNNTIAATDTNGNLILSPDGVGVIQTNNSVVPRADNLYDLGTANLRYRQVSVGTGGLSFSDNTVQSTAWSGVVDRSSVPIEFLRLPDPETLVFPPTPTSLGTKGEVVYAGGYIYICVATNTWVRSAVETAWG